MDINNASLHALRQHAKLAEITVRRTNKEMLRLKAEILRLKGLHEEEIQKQLELELQYMNEAFEEELNVLCEADLEPDDEIGDDPQKKNKEKKKRTSFGHQERKNLLTEHVNHPMDDADLACPHCGVDMQLNGLEDTSTTLEVVPRHCVKTIHHYPKYSCKCCNHIESQEVEAKVIPGGLIGNSLAVEVAVDRYFHQIPFDRLVKMYGIDNFEIHSQTLWDQMDALGTLLEPIHQRIREYIAANEVIGIDQSPWKMLRTEKKGKKSELWQIWQMSTTNAAYFEILPTKNAVDGSTFLKKYSGTVICDAASTHIKLENSGSFLMANCWAHLYRKVKSLSGPDKVRARELATAVKKLYAIEHEAGDDIEKKKFLRDTKSREQIALIENWMKSQVTFLKGSPFQSMLTYLSNQWESLLPFLDNPLIPLDNNQTERGYVWVAIGRRNYIGTVSKRGAKVTEIMFTILETARRNGINPKDYLRQAIAEVLSGNEPTLPIK